MAVFEKGGPMFGLFPEETARHDKNVSGRKLHERKRKMKTKQKIHRGIKGCKVEGGMKRTENGHLL
jgi:hypothetical protein